jgi:iron-sulfur cluster repair protein YtfE (RIC family)
MTSAGAVARPETANILLVHNIFRRQVGGLPGLVVGVAAGDTERAAGVVDVLDDVTTALRRHLQGEDELLWPLLLEQSPADGALILRMEEQHERIRELGHLAAENATAFVATADPVSRGELAETLTELAVAVLEHLADEEAHVLPLIQRVLTVPQWLAISDRCARGGTTAR